MQIEVCLATQTPKDPPKDQVRLRARRAASERSGDGPRSPIQGNALQLSALASGSRGAPEAGLRGMRVNTKRMELAEMLERTALFSSLSQSEVRQLAAKTVRKILSAGEFLFHEGDACKGFHIIARGQVRMFKSSASGREQVLAVNVAGESVAEIPVFDDGPYPASGVAIEETEIAFISRQDFHEYCLAHPEVALKVLAFVGARLRRLVGIIEELSFTTTRQRLVSVLVRLAQSEGRKTERH